MTRRYGTLLLIFFSVILFFIAGSKLITTSFFTSHDGLGHVIRLTDFYESFTEGQIPVRISKRLDNGLGYPFYNFNYPLIYYFGAVFQTAGFDSVTTFKLLLFASIVLGGAGMYLFARMFFNRRGAFVAAVFYTFAPYRFLDIYVRGNVGEALGLSILPFFLLSILLITKKRKWGSLLFVGSLSFLILIHNITAMIGFCIGLALITFQSITDRHKPDIKRYITLLAFVLGLTAFFTLPAAIEGPFTRLSSLGSEYGRFFPTLREVLYSPWGFGLWEQGPFPGKMSPQLGLIHEAVFGIAVLILSVLLLRRKNGKAETVPMLFIALVLISLFFALPVSRFIWNRLYLLQVMQMPWRFVGYATFGCSVLAGYVVFKAGKWQVPAAVILILLVLFANRNHISVNQYIRYVSPFNTNGVYWHSTATYWEHAPRDAPLLPAEPNHDGDILFATGSAKRVIWRSNYQQFHVTVKSDGFFRDNVYYYPGWNVTVDGKPGRIEYLKDPLRRLYVHLTPGFHVVEFYFIETWYRALADFISVLSFIAGTLLLVASVRKRKVARRR